MAMAILNVSLSLQYIQFRLVLLKGIKMSVFVLVSKGLNGQHMPLKQFKIPYSNVSLVITHPLCEIYKK